MYRNLLYLLVAVGALFSLSCTAPISFVEKDGKPAFDAAMSSLKRLRAKGNPDPRYIAVVDFTQPSCLRRMAIYDLRKGDKKTYLAAHAANTGNMNAEIFSNAFQSEMSSLGMFRAGGEYKGKHGRSLRLHGLEKGLNDKAYKRGIVVHPADYVSSRAMLINLLYGYGPRIGRSSGCFAVNPLKIDEIIDTLKDGGFLYAYHDSIPDAKTGEFSIVGLPIEFDVFHFGGGGAMLAPLDYRIDGILLPFENGLHRSVAFISHPSGHPAVLGRFSGFHSKENALYSSFDNCVRSYFFGHMSPPRNFSIQTIGTHSTSCPSFF